MSGKAQKLDDVKIEKIKQLLADGYKQRFIAALMSISQPMVCEINKGRR